MARDGSARCDGASRDLRRAMAVYPVVDLSWLARRNDLEQAVQLVASALRGGATLLQLREKGERFSDVVRLCQRIRDWTEQADVPLIINDRLDLALAVQADGVHVGQRDMLVAEVKAMAQLQGRSDLLVGLSVTTVEQARAGVAAGADYLSVSPVFETPTKPDIEPAAGLAGVRAIRAAFADKPIVAIGGIKPARVGEVIAAGADGVAFISALEDAPEAGVRAMAQAVAHAVHSERKKK
jgi:thiamine-phosphate pyrophosphorylase